MTKRFFQFLVLLVGLSAFAQGIWRLFGELQPGIVYASTVIAASVAGWRLGQTIHGKGWDTGANKRYFQFLASLVALSVFTLAIRRLFGEIEPGVIYASTVICASAAGGWYLRAGVPTQTAADT